MKLAIVLLAFAAGCGRAEIREHPGGKEVSTAPFLRVVTEKESPVQEFHIRSKDGIDVPAALRKPKGEGPFPALIYFHGWPGGRGMEELREWVLGADGSPVLERFLQEGFVIVAADYRAGGGVDEALRPIPDFKVSYLDDCLAVVDRVRSLPYVDAARINLYGSSFGANLVAHVIGRRKVHAAAMAGGVVMGFLGAEAPALGPGADRLEAYRHLKIDEPVARKHIEAIACPVLLIIGKDDFLTAINRQLYDRMTQAGKPVRMELYENVYHGFEVGPHAMAGPPSNRKEPVLEGTLDALQRALDFVRAP
jgi:dipeptidyl aminopeptidase/acylaminoacyl peptidase